MGALTGLVLRALATSSHEEGVGWRGIRVRLPGFRMILEREMRSVLRRKLPYKAACSWPAELSRSLRRERQMAVGWRRGSDLRAPPNKSS